MPQHQRSKADAATRSSHKYGHVRVLRFTRSKRNPLHNNTAFVGGGPVQCPMFVVAFNALRLAQMSHGKTSHLGLPHLPPGKQPVRIQDHVHRRPLRGWRQQAGHAERRYQQTRISQPIRLKIQAPRKQTPRRLLRKFASPKGSCR